MICLAIAVCSKVALINNSRVRFNRRCYNFSQVRMSLLILPPWFHEAMWRRSPFCAFAVLILAIVPFQTSVALCTDSLYTISFFNSQRLLLENCYLLYDKIIIIVMIIRRNSTINLIIVFSVFCQGQ